MLVIKRITNLKVMIMIVTGVKILIIYFLQSLMIADMLMIAMMQSARGHSGTARLHDSPDSGGRCE